MSLSFTEKYDVVVVGAGHAGCESAMAAARMGLRTALYTITLALTLGSLAIYGNVAFGPPRPKPAFAFLMVPLASWLAIAFVVPTAAMLSRRRTRPGNPA